MQQNDRIVARWIFIGVGMLIIQVMLGGITRLTGSGLSITEWDVITGAMPPLNQADWMQEFEKYQRTDQFRELNFDFTLGDFKFIYFWEWFHRLWGRLIGVVFAIPFVIFLIQKRFRKEMIAPLVILFLMGALQGVVGWIMVMSGLSGDAVYVAPTRLALHFILAMVLVCYAFWFGLTLSVPSNKLISHRGLHRFTVWLIVLMGIQLIFGALMAGHKAAPAAYTWPDINGTWLPGGMFEHGLASLIDNRITIHFVHRNLAYLILLLIIIWTVKSWKLNSSTLFRKVRILPLVFVMIQVLLGILTIISSLEISPASWKMFEWMAQLHQLTAMFLLLSLTWCLYLVRKNSNMAI